MDPLDADARDILERYKASLGPTPDDVSANWSAIAAQAEVQSDLAYRRRTARRAFGLGALVASLAAAAVLLWLRPWSGATMDANGALPSAQYGQLPAGVSDGEAIARQPETHRRVARPTIPDLDPTIGPEAPAADTVAVEPDPAVDHFRKRPRTAATVPPPDLPLSALRAEADLVARARTALSTGRNAAALAMSAEHGERFAGGALSEEIATIRVGALCALGPDARWRKALRAFDKRYPGSPLRVHLRDDCF